MPNSTSYILKKLSENHLKQVMSLSDILKIPPSTLAQKTLIDATAGELRTDHIDPIQLSTLRRHAEKNIKEIQAVDSKAADNFAAILSELKSKKNEYYIKFQQFEQDIKSVKMNKTIHATNTVCKDIVVNRINPKALANSPIMMKGFNLIKNIVKEQKQYQEKLTIEFANIKTNLDHLVTRMMPFAQHAINMKIEESLRYH